MPSRKIGPASVKRLRAAAEPDGLEGAEMLSVSDEALKGAGLGPAAIKKLRALDVLLTSFRDLSQRVSATEVAIEIIEATGYLAYLRQSDPVTAEDRAANVQEIVTSIAEYESQLESATNAADGSTPPPAETAGLGLAGARTPLQAYLDQAALTSPDETDGSGSITLMTLHAAKGLEFPVVFMVGLEEMTFPSRRAIDDLDPSAMEEERRLCYVGMTRAMQRLYLSAARYRRIYGTGGSPGAPARFLGELPDAVVGNFPELAGARRWAQARSDAMASDAAAVATDDRGGDRVEYDEPSPSRGGSSRRGSSPVSPVSPVSPGRPGTPQRNEPVPGAYGAVEELYAPGAAVHHNLFGRGVIRSADGTGSKARLTIEFPGHGMKKVIARFVKPAGGS